MQGADVVEIAAGQTVANIDNARHQLAAGYAPHDDDMGGLAFFGPTASQQDRLQHVDFAGKREYAGGFHLAADKHLL